MSEVITLGRRLNDLNIKIQDKILSNEKLIKLLASKTNDLSDIKEVDCPNDYVDKNIFFTIKGNMFWNICFTTNTTDIFSVINLFIFISIINMHIC